MEMLFDPSHVDLQTADPKDVICYLSSIGEAGGEEDSDKFSHDVRLSAIFVILVVSTVATVFPVIATRITWLRIPLYAYLLVRYFGAGVIIATAFIHLLDPAYEAIGPQSCVGMTGAWANFSWPPALALTSAMCVFLLDFVIECHVASTLGGAGHGDVEETVTTVAAAATNCLHHSHDDDPQQQIAHHHHQSKQEEESINDEEHQVPSRGDADEPSPAHNNALVTSSVGASLESIHESDSTSSSTVISVDKNGERSFGEQIGAFMVLEMGVIVHSIIIGLNLGVSGSEFGTLYPVLLFHQSFEGMGIGARLSAIPFPARLSWLPWLLCVAYGLTTPIAVAVGLSLRSTYTPESFTAHVVSGVLDSISAGILLYTGFVELLARDFLLHPERTLDRYRVSFAIFCLYLGIAIMGLLGKWA